MLFSGKHLPKPSIRPRVFGSDTVIVASRYARSIVAIMRFSRIAAPAVAAFTGITYAFGQGSPDPPDVRLSVLPPFSSNAIKHYRAGEDTLKSPPFRLTTTAAMTALYGDFGPPLPKISDFHGWRVQVFATFSKKVFAAVKAAKDGTAADLNDGPGLREGEPSRYIVARVRGRHFRWGSAVSFLSQSTQDTGQRALRAAQRSLRVRSLGRDR